jgi:hypothetical protein
MLHETKTIWLNTPSSDSWCHVDYADYEGRSFIWNAVKYLPDNKAAHNRKQLFSQSLPLAHKISDITHIFKSIINVPKSWIKTSGLHTEACAELPLIFLEKRKHYGSERILHEIYILHHECSTQSTWSVCRLHIKILVCKSLMVFFKNKLRTIMMCYELPFLRPKNKNACFICADNISSLTSVN